MQAFDLRTTLGPLLDRMNETMESLKYFGGYGTVFPAKAFDSDWLSRIVVMPKYDTDRNLNMRIEIDPPSSTYRSPILTHDSNYVALGYDQRPDSKVRHWRYVVSRELEKEPEIMQPSPFAQFQISRGLSASLYQRDRPDVPELLDVGTFKGWVKISKVKEDNLLPNPYDFLEEQGQKLPEPERAKLDKYLNIYSNYKLDNMFKDMEKRISRPAQCTVRLYILDARGLVSRDVLGLSDPYLHIELGNTVIDERDKHQNDKKDVSFFKMYELKTELPSNSMLKIQVMDYDYIGSDLIGETVISLDDRFYSPFWRALPNKPVEDRALSIPQSATAQGMLRLWIEIFETEKVKMFPIWDITPQPPAVFLPPPSHSHIGIRAKSRGVADEGREVSGL